MKDTRNFCNCGAIGTSLIHPCPYNEDINNNNTPICNCCDKCTKQCADDI